MFGIRIIEDCSLTEDGDPIEIKRTWRERLFSLPWRPFKATRTVIPRVPMKGGLRLAEGVYVMHPETAKKLRECLPIGK